MHITLSTNHTYSHLRAKNRAIQICSKWATFKKCQRHFGFWNVVHKHAKYNLNASTFAPITYIYLMLLSKTLFLLLKKKKEKKAYSHKQLWTRTVNVVGLRKWRRWNSKQVFKTWYIASTKSQAYFSKPAFKKPGLWMMT